MQTSIQSVEGHKYAYGEGAPSFYPASGGSDDWSHLSGIDISYTIELRDTGYHGFELPESQILGTCKENVAGIDTVYKYVKVSLFIKIYSEKPERKATEYSSPNIPLSLFG